MANKINITIDQGATFSETFSVADEDGNVVDLTIYDGTAQMRKHYSSSNAVSFGVVLESDGKATISLTANTTSGITPGRYLYDVEISDNGTIVRIVEGIATVTPNMTR